MGIRRPLTARDARFCFQFVLDSALAIQQQKRELPDLFAPQRLKTKGMGAILYKFQDNSVVPCDQVPGDQELDGMYAWGSTEGDLWQVTWNSVEGFVRNVDVVQVDDF